VKQALVVGGGIGGMSCAIRLRALDYEVDLLDKDPSWRVYGAGITITGPTLRAFKQLGILAQVKALGFCSGDARVFTADGDPAGTVSVPQIAPDIPATGGIMRPVLHQILSSTTRAVGVRVRLGVSVENLSETDTGVVVHTTDGVSRKYDLVVGADGVYSHLRMLLFPEAPRPRYTGQGCWRVVAPRPPEVTSAEFYFGGPHKVGLNPCSPTQLYMFLLSRAPDNRYVAPEDQLPRLHNLMDGYGGRIAAIRAELGPESSIIYRPLETLLMPPPWNRGRVVLIGDAVHATTPHLASGAGMAVEDALVLTEELSGAGSISPALRRFMERRWDRCRLVVESSVRIGELEIAGADAQEQQRLLSETSRMLAGPI
jgi:2-polyprenyl-6-methoxyphenol hydroxylase-like FAD-dependent oxidoreductase